MGHSREASTTFSEACTAFLRIMSRIGANAFEHFRHAALRSAPFRFEGRPRRAAMPWCFVVSQLEPGLLQFIAAQAHECVVYLDALDHDQIIVLAL